MTISHGSTKQPERASSADEVSQSAPTTHDVDRSAARDDAVWRERLGADQVRHAGQPMSLSATLVAPLPTATGATGLGKIAGRTTTSGILRVFHRQPDRAGDDRHAGRVACLDDFMAIEPRALERAFFGLFSDEDASRRMKGSAAIIDISGPLMQRGAGGSTGTRRSASASRRRPPTRPSAPSS